MKRLLPKLALFVSMGALLGVVTLAQQPQPASPVQTASRCRISGRITSGSVPLPGVSVGVHAGDTLRAATSTDIDGSYAILFSPNASYRLSADFSGFTGASHDVILAAPPCDQTIDFQLALIPRTEGLTSGRTGGGSGGQAAARDERGAARAREGEQRFQTLNVRPDAAGAAASLELATAAQDIDEATRLLPAGFSLETAQADAIAITGNSAATNVDRGLMNERFQMVNLGQLDPATGQIASGFGPQPFGITGPGGAPGGPDGLGGPGFPGGRGGGPGGRGGFVLGGRGARGQRPYQGSATYTFGGSILDSPPYQLRPDVPVTQPQFAQNTFGGTFGGPLKVPRLYSNTNRRTTFQVNYTGSETNNVFDQYATVPTDAQRNGDFSSSAIPLVDPATGQPFPRNQIPPSRVDPAAATLLPFIPSPNLPGTTRNYHVSTAAHSSSEAVSIRLTQNLSRTADQPQNGPVGRGGGFGGGFGGGGRGGGRPFGGPGGGRGTSAVLNAQVQYRHTDTQALNIFPNLGSDTTNTNISAPITLNVRHGRSIQNLTVNLTHATIETTNAFANAENVAALAGIDYPGSTDPLNWGVPNLSFTGFTGARTAPASLRSENRLTTSYAWIHPAAKHLLRMGGDYRLDRSDATINGNSRGSFTFTGVYASDGTPIPAGSGADFADFLLGLPQQATLQVGGRSQLRQHAIDAYVEDNWQRGPKLTFNLGLRYELARPYVELNHRMANLDVTQGFTAVAPVLPGGVGPYSGAFPTALLNTDANNLGPRLGFAYRARPTTILRGGYGITYNSGSYASIARQLAGQPPFADTETVTGTDSAPLTLAEALLSPAPATTNNWGVDRDYALGMIQTWNATITNNVTTNWLLQAGYTGIKGTDLDILRAPVLGPGGALIPGTQAFIWESSGGHSIMNAATFQVRRRLAAGYSGGLSYTVARAMDNASSLGAGGPVVAQNDKDLGAEWARSSFDRRHQISGNVYAELPWGPNRHWLKDGGTLAALFGEWSAQLTLTLQSGTPLTARVLGAAGDLLRGVNGSLRGNYAGGPISLSDPTVDEFFNVTAFSVPAPGQFGDSSRNMIPGPGARQLNGLFQRDVRLGSNRSLTLQINAINLLNTVQWAAVDTNINSQTFGQVLSARPMRTMTLTARFRF
jgi:trimeric autotransporter adhesin